MTVLLLIECAGAGAGRHVADLAESLTNYGHAAHLIYNSESTDSMFRQRVSALRRKVAGLVGIPMRHVPHPKDALLIARLREYIARNGPFDIIHCHSTKAGFIGRLGLRNAGSAIVYTPHAPLTMSPTLSWWAKPAVRALEVGLSRLTDAIIAVSDYEADHLASLGIAPQKIFVVANGVRAVESAEQLRAAARARLGITKGRTAIGCVGRLEKQKRVDLVLRAVSGLPADLRSTVELAVVGGGSLENELKSLASGLGIADRVVWVGEVEEAASLMAAFDVFLLSSDYEAMPYTLLEALAAGIPVVATRIGGVDAVITDGRNGFVVERGDVSRMSHRLGFLIEQSDLRSRMSREALAVSRRFSVGRMTDQTLAVYSSVLSHTDAVQPVSVLNH
jgi:glycosyltransferase involved in cell wall biosynthesis